MPLELRFGQHHQPDGGGWRWRWSVCFPSNNGFSIANAKIQGVHPKSTSVSYWSYEIFLFVLTTREYTASITSLNDLSLCQNAGYSPPRLIRIAGVTASSELATCGTEPVPCQNVFRSGALRAFLPGGSVTASVVFDLYFTIRLLINQRLAQRGGGKFFVQTCKFHAAQLKRQQRVSV